MNEWLQNFQNIEDWAIESSQNKYSGFFIYCRLQRFIQDS